MMSNIIYSKNGISKRQGVFADSNRYKEIDIPKWYNPITGDLVEEPKGNVINTELQRPNFEKGRLIVNLKEHEKSTRTQDGKLTSFKGNGGFTDETYKHYAALIDIKNKYGRNAGKAISDIVNGNVNQASLRQFGDINHADFANVVSAVRITKMLGMKYLKHIYTQIVSTENSDRLTIKVGKIDAPDNMIYDDEGFYTSIGDTKKPQFSFDTMGMVSTGFSYGIFDDFFYEQYDIDPLAPISEAYAAQFDNKINKKIADVINALSATGSSSLSALTSEHYTNSAADFFDNAINTIETKERAGVNTIISTRKTLRVVIKNLNQNNVNNRDQLSIGTPIGVNGVLDGTPLPGVRWGYDNYNTADQLTMFDNEWFILGYGPRRFVTVRDEIMGNTKTMQRVWNGFKIFTMSLAADTIYSKFSGLD